MQTETLARVIALCSSCHSFNAAEYFPREAPHLNEQNEMEGVLNGQGACYKPGRLDRPWWVGGPCWEGGGHWKL